MKKIFKVLPFVLLIGLITYFFVFFLNQENYYKYLQSVQVGDRQYSLYREVIFQDSYWVVLEHDINFNGYKDVQVRSKPLIGYEEPMILLNWDDGVANDNPNIKLINDRYLVFERGGLSHSLYDVEKNELLINYENIKSQIQKMKPGEKISNNDFLIWKAENIHEEIKEIIN